MENSEMDKLCSFIEHFNDDYKLEYKIEKKRIKGQFLFKGKSVYSFWYSEDSEELFDDIVLNDFNMTSSKLKLKKDKFLIHLKNRIFKILGIQEFNFI